MRLGNLFDRTYKYKQGTFLEQGRNPVSKCSCQTPRKCKFLKQYREIQCLETLESGCIRSDNPYLWFKTEEIQRPQDILIYKSEKRGCCNTGFSFNRYHQVIIHRTNKNEVFLTWENVFDIFNNDGDGWTTQNPNKKWWCGHDRKHKISIDDYIRLSTFPPNCNQETIDDIFDKATAYFGWLTTFIPKFVFCKVLVSKKSVLCLLSMRRFCESDLSLLPKEIILMIARMVIQIEKADFHYKYKDCYEEFPTKKYKILC